jgi:hypothetical protein
MKKEYLPYLAERLQKRESAFKIPSKEVADMVKRLVADAGNAARRE